MGSELYIEEARDSRNVNEGSHHKEDTCVLHVGSLQHAIMPLYPVNMDLLHMTMLKSIQNTKCCLDC